MTPIPIVVAIACLAVSGIAAAEVRIYDVDARYRDELVQALRQVFTDSTGQTVPRADVSLLPTGQILIDTTSERHAEIEAILDAVAQSGAAETPSATLRYWVLIGVPQGRDGTPLPAMLEPVVPELRAALGDLDFSVVDTASLVTKSGDGSMSQSETLEVMQSVTINDRTLNAEIMVQHERQELAVVVSMDQGEFLVLGDSMIQVDERTRGALVFVVHWVDE